MGLVSLGQPWLEYQEIDSGVVDIQELILNGPLQIQLILNHALRTSLGLEVTRVAPHGPRQAQGRSSHKHIQISLLSRWLLLMRLLFHFGQTVITLITALATRKSKTEQREQ